MARWWSSVVVAQVFSLLIRGKSFWKEKRLWVVPKHCERNKSRQPESVKMLSLNVLLIISTVVTNAKSIGDGENDFDRKRFDLGLETCIENFDVHVDKIIRTQDSRAMGAKYLNEAEVPVRDDCMKMCCETPLCDVFVLEQKVPGSCYLFHCGSPEDFKCKFTQHKNYTSAVLTYDNGFRDLNNRMKPTKHEEELNMLRKSESSPDPTSTSFPLSTKVPAISMQTDKQNRSTASQCSRFQYECRTSKECIAIYNACDGVPQCADGSDEKPELDCPTVTGSTHPKTFHDQLKSLKEKDQLFSPTEKVAEFPASTEPSKHVKSFGAKSQVPQNLQTSQFLGYFPFGYPQQSFEEISEINRQRESSQPLANQPKYMGREGEIIQYPVNGVQWPNYRPQHQDENGFVFNHKESGMVSENADSQPLNSYGSNDMSRTEYIKYKANPASNVYYSGSNPAYYLGPNGWIQRFPQLPPPPPPRGVEDGHQRLIMPMYGNGISGSIPSDYYYEDSQFRGRYAQPPRRFYNPEVFHKNQKNPMGNDMEKPEAEKEYKGQEISRSTEVDGTIKNSKTSTATSVKIETTTKASLPTSIKETKPQQTTALKLVEHLRMNENDMRATDGVNERPSGAILSLTLGVCITAIMITLVGCRLRVVRKRMRRNGKSPFVHDADFLVNGMYL